MSFSAEDKPIGEILNKAVFDIPRNQRKYVWNKGNWQDLFEDVLFSIEEQKPHFIGSVVLEKRDKAEGLTYYTIIDGQQRFTTITLFLVAIMKHFLEKGMEDDFKGAICYLQSTNVRNQSVTILSSDYHLSINQVVEGIVNKENTDGSINTFLSTHILSDKADKSIKDSIKFFYDSLKEDISKYPNQEERLRTILMAILEMIVVKIESTSEDDSYTIFEILNARGQDLKSHELLKNYIMRYIQPISSRDVAKREWESMEADLGRSIERFVSHYVTHIWGDIKSKYKNSYTAIQKETRGKDIQIFFNDLKLKAKYYLKFINPSNGDDGNCSALEYEIFNFFKSKKFIQIRPVLLSLIHHNELGDLSDRDYENTLKFIYNFYICYTIIGEEKSNKLEDTVYKYAEMLESDCSKENLNAFATSLKNKIPDLDWFTNAFKNIGFSNHFDVYKGSKEKNRVQIILEIIEKFVSQTNSVPAFTIEHMLPDSDNMKNSQIGNLIPLEERLNGKLGDKPLAKKFEVYKESNFKSCRNITNRYTPDNFDPDKRTQFLARLIYNNILELNQLDFT